MRSRLGRRGQPGLAIIIALLLQLPLAVAHPYQHLEAPRIVAEPTPSIVGWGDAILSCNASGNATISWFRADGTIVARATPTVGIREGETDGELAYYCAATIAHVGTVRSHTTKVKFHHGMTSNVTVTRGNSVYLPNCITNDWLSGNVGVVRLPNGGLLVRNVSVPNQAHFTFWCGSRGMTIYVASKVHSLSFVTEPPTEAIIAWNSTHVIPCVGSGWPAPSAIWYRNGKRIDDDDDNGNQILQDGGMLIFYAVSMQSSGIYTCVIENEREKRNRSVHVIVSDVPRVSSSFISKIGLKDNTVTLTCPLLHFRYSASIPRERQRLNITWLINNTEINHANRSKLVITDVAMGDEGMYQCFASNLLQNVQTTFRLRVADAPGSPRGLSAVTVKNQLRITWSLGIPPCDFSSLCQRNMYSVKMGSTRGEQFLYEARENLTSVVVDVTKSSNWKFLDWLYSTKIQVVVFNWALSISSIWATTTTIRLNAFVDLTAENLGVSTMTISYDCPIFWNPVTPSEMTHTRTLTVFSSDGDQFMPDVQPYKYPTPFYVSGLAPFTLFNFIARLHFTVTGKVIKSPSITCMTSMTAPRRSPVITSVYRLNATSCLIAWTLSTETASHFDVTVFDHDDNIRLVRSLSNGDGARHEGVITALEPWVDYAFRVQACCSVVACREWSLKNDVDCAASIPLYTTRHLCNPNYCNCTGTSLPKLMKRHPLTQADVDFRLVDVFAREAIVAWRPLVVFSSAVRVAYRLRVTSTWFDFESTRLSAGNATRIAGLCPDTDYTLILSVLTSDRKEPAFILPSIALHTTNPVSVVPPTDLNVTWFDDGFRLRWLVNDTCPTVYNISYCQMRNASRCFSSALLSNGTDVSTTIDGRRLVPAATYEIKVKSEWGDVWSESVSAANGLYPTIVSLVSSNDSDDVLLECSATGYPAPTVRLTQGGRGLTTADSCRRRSHLTECSFRISNDGTVAARLYNCWARNELGARNASVYVHWSSIKLTKSRGVSGTTIASTAVSACIAFGILLALLIAARKRKRAVNKVKKKSAVGPHRKESENNQTDTAEDGESGLNEPHQKCDLDRNEATNEIYEKHDEIPWRKRPESTASEQAVVSDRRDPGGNVFEKLKFWKNFRRRKELESRYVMTEVCHGDDESGSGSRRPSRKSSGAVSTKSTGSQRRRLGVVSLDQASFLTSSTSESSESRESTPATVTTQDSDVSSREISPALTVESPDEEAVEREFAFDPDMDGPEAAAADEARRRVSVRNGDYIELPRRSTVEQRKRLSYVSVAELREVTQRGGGDLSGSSGYRTGGTSSGDSYYPEPDGRTKLEPTAEEESKESLYTDSDGSEGGLDI